jgi:hypothetical protein
MDDKHLAGCRSARTVSRFSRRLEVERSRLDDHPHVSAARADTAEMRAGELGDSPAVLDGRQRVSLAGEHLARDLRPADGARADAMGR